ncbi:TonB-dependent receptor domain-containing protein [Rubrivirga sp. IMCC45206]|uniref:TonB-dependent receptor n=1 Tax=Rubrivirga sp. IMCC45206 TaxID=3391614 RepID=UPI00398F9BF3
MSLPTPRTSRALRSAGLLAVLLAPLAVAAQTGTISGTVVDGEFGGGLPSASVYVVELGTGDAADIDGRYEVQRVPAGTYSVRYSFTGYAPQLVESVTVAAGETVTLNVTLAPGAELAEVVVEAEEILATNSEAGLLRLRARAAQVSDAISAEAISQSGASDAGDAMERVTGASVVGGRFVFVRGLGDRYATTQLNGATLPTADPDRRAVPFDLFPSGLLENIVTLKTFTPDQPGSFSGGLVNISTRSFPEAFSLALSASGGGNTETQFRGDFLESLGGGVPLTGVGGDRAIPAALQSPDARLPTPTDVRFDPAGASALRDASRAFGTSFAPVSAAPPVNTSYAASLGNRVSLAGYPLGFVLGGTWGHSSSYYADGVTARFSGQGTDVSPFAPDFVAVDTRGTEEVTWGGIANATYQIGSAHELGVNALVSRAAESEARFLEGPAAQIGTYLQQRVQQYTERHVASGQLRGRHRVAGVELAWRGSVSQTGLDQPDLRFFNNTIDTLNVGQATERVRFGVTGTSIPDPLRYFRTLDESLAQGAVDLTIPLRGLGLRGGQLKVGGVADRTARDVTERRFQYDVRVPAGDGLGGTSADSIAAFFDRTLGAYAETTLADGRTRVQFTGTTLSDQTDPANQYAGTLDVAAGYAMVELPVGARLRAIVGARVETTDLRIEGDGVDLGRQRLDAQIAGATGAARDSLTARRDGLGAIDRVDVLPSLNLVYALTDRVNLRAAATRTLARPTFREIAPFAAQDFGFGELLSGNPALDRTLITNLDVRWEWFARPGDIVAVSGYTKRLDAPIERVIIDANGQTSFENVDRATIWGAEVEARTALAPLARALAHVSVGANVTLTRSTISRSAGEVALGADPERPLQGQSPYLVNLDLAYGDGTTSAGLYFNVFGRRLSRVSRVGTPDVYEEPAPTLDLVASRRVADNWSLKLSAKNLLNAPFREVYDVDAEGLALPLGLTAPLFQRYDRGTSVSLGLSFSPRLGAAPPAIPSPSQTTPTVGLDD